MMHLDFEIAEEHHGVRLDKALADLAGEDVSRARVQALIKGGQASVNGAVCAQASRKVSVGDVVALTLPPPEEAEPQAQHIPLDILFEDEHMLVINKPAGMVVHPGAGNHEGTLVNALLHHCGESLSGIGGVLRPGIVHRLDKDTSGLMVAAKNDKAHKGLSAQLADRSLSRVYQALVLGVPVPPLGVVDRSIGRHPGNRLKMAAGVRGGREARTHYRVLEAYRGAVSLMECVLESGRTHQIRVHMELLKHPIIGDPLYGPQKNAVQSALKKAEYEAAEIEAVLAFPRQALHAAEISFVHPVSEEEMGFEAPLPADMERLISILSN